MTFQAPLAAVFPPTPVMRTWSPVLRPWAVLAISMSPVAGSGRAIQPDGTYTLSTFAEKDGAIPGHRKVMIIANDGDPTLMPGSSPGYKPPKDLIPKKYGDLATSGPEADVTRDKPTIDFELK